MRGLGYRKAPRIIASSLRVSLHGRTSPDPPSSNNSECQWVHRQERESRPGDHGREPLNPRTSPAEEAPWPWPMAQDEGRGYRQLPDGSEFVAELQWYEAHGIEKKDIKIKFPFLD